MLLCCRYSHTCTYSVRDLVHELPPALSQSLLDSMYRLTIMHVPLFKGLAEEIIAEICVTLKPLVLTSGEFVFKENKPGRAMYRLSDY